MCARVGVCIGRDVSTVLTGREAGVGVWLTPWRSARWLGPVRYDGHPRVQGGNCSMARHKRQGTLERLSFHGIHAGRGERHAAQRHVQCK